MYPLADHQVSGPGLVPLIKQLGNELIGCELGVCRGHNLIYLLDRLPEIKLAYAIDPYIPYIDEPWGLINQEEINGWKAVAFDILSSHENRVKFLQLPSVEAATYIDNESLDYIFIDGDHNYDPVLNDCRAYWNKIRRGGLFSGHDWNLENVRNAVSKFRQEHDITTEIKFTNYNVWYWYKD